MSLFPTVGHRAWWAYNCLDRDSQGKLPSRRGLEVKYDLANGTLKKLIWDESVRPPNLERARQISLALQCSMDWLFFGEGAQPKASWPIPPRPDKPQQSPRAGISEREAARFEREAKSIQQRPSERRRG